MHDWGGQAVGLWAQPAGCFDFCENIDDETRPLGGIRSNFTHEGLTLRQGRNIYQPKPHEHRLWKPLDQELNV